MRREQGASSYVPCDVRPVPVGFTMFCYLSVLLSGKLPTPAKRTLTAPLWISLLGLRPVRGRPAFPDGFSKIGSLTRRFIVHRSSVCKPAYHPMPSQSVPRPLCIQAGTWSGALPSPLPMSLIRPWVVQASSHYMPFTGQADRSTNTPSLLHVRGICVTPTQ